MNKPYRSCSCRAPATTGQGGKRRPGRLLGSRCPDLGKKGHGAWYARYEAPPGPDGRRRQPRLGPFGIEREAKTALVEALGQVAAGAHVADRNTRFGEYLDRWLTWREPELKPRTLESYREAFGLYWKPALGHVRLADLREGHIRDVHAAMRKLNTSAEDRDKSELLRRLAAARATVPHLPGTRVRTSPLSETRIKRVTAPLVTALNQCKTLPVNPAKGIGGKARKTRPLVWTAPRVEQWQRDGLRPSAVMVWTREQAGAFLDHVVGDPWYSLWAVAVHTGMRRHEIADLRWADTDLDRRRIHVRGGKTENSDRQIALDVGTAAVLRAHRKTQAGARLAWGPGWAETGLVFTREDGSALREGAISERFALLAGKAGLPPIRFHDLRHGAASMAIAAGVPVKSVAEQLGHATAAFTQDVYAAVSDEMAEQAADLLAAFIPRKTPAGGA
jgi:integrase